ncbi:conserved Plasmodium protein, unknown function [Plasmodium berghei]|uniref:Vacuolar membrane protein n=2 Tax=Plasmodium berghei TaxID=5821 RepID=A0A509AYM1_PLABA|nr:conserved Plasmodium protein, unknown function [Plasmodium berghei ANKA]CXJ05696.1 conserved Plasmodium protein, unknown function [Plasmodium berghei]SCL98843.1 conserved Plasmodium protein, unknown function [Plasmodium berghei]SCM16914.1 conserved Plasmodium protein, unknown function [Plasmodium berghei]SCM18712.1 conserved Plasmodium protein, unknown function [Plasmodium berghei]SCN28148.1 conserved Plasmodium protein, unknown function [Plasmodium berghei]|eukprot:XP_034423797.1 conserved Plasmodium protein, unknown function [Plasmodium berghei ANKA]
MDEHCYIMPGEFGLLVQGVLAVSSISILIAKHIFEKPRRTLLNFFEDVALLLIGNTVIHFFNIFFSMFFFHCKILLYLFQVNMDECSIYFTQVILDGSLGLYLQATLLDIFKVTKYFKFSFFHNKYKSIMHKHSDILPCYPSFDLNNDSNDKQSINNLIYNNTDTIAISPNNNKMTNDEYTTNKNSNIIELSDLNSNSFNKNCEDGQRSPNSIDINKIHKSIDYNNNEKFQDRNKLMSFNIELLNKEVCININGNNNLKNDEIYENKDIYILDKTESNNSNSLIDNLILWLSVILSAKFIVIFVFVLTSPITNIFTFYTISCIKDVRYRLIFIMVIIPFFFNFVLYYISDIIIKKKSENINVINDNP